MYISSGFRYLNPTSAEVCLPHASIVSSLSQLMSLCRLQHFLTRYHYILSFACRARVFIQVAHFHHSSDNSSFENINFSTISITHRRLMQMNSLRRGKDCHKKRDNRCRTDIIIIHSHLSTVTHTTRLLLTTTL